MVAIIIRLAHRSVGLAVALPLLLLVITGIPLQFTGALQLGTTGVTQSWVHEAYGIEAPNSVLRADAAAQLGDTLFVGERTHSISGVLCGAVNLTGFTLVVSSAEMQLVPVALDAPVERTNLSYDITRCGISPHNDLVIETAMGFLASSDLGASWSSVITPDVRWLEVVKTPVTAQERVRFAAAKLSWERWLQDLHSGRFFGEVGVWIMSIAGFAFIILGISGILIWLAARKVAKAAKAQRG